MLTQTVIFREYWIENCDINLSPCSTAMSSASTCSFKDRLRVYSDERVQRAFYGAVQGEQFDLVQDLYTQSGIKDSFPKSLTAGRSVLDTLKCTPSKRKIKVIKKPELEDFTEKVCRFLVESRTPIYRDARGKGFCPVNRGDRYIGVKDRYFPISGELYPPGKSGFR
eukprot:sb/3472398/